MAKEWIARDDCKSHFAMTLLTKPLLWSLPPALLFPFIFYMWASQSLLSVLSSTGEGDEGTRVILRPRRMSICEIKTVK